MCVTFHVEVPSDHAAMSRHSLEIRYRDSHPTSPHVQAKQQQSGNTHIALSLLHNTQFTPQSDQQAVSPRELDIFSAGLFNLYFLFCFPFSDFMVVSRVVLKCLQVTTDQVVRTRHLLSCENPLFTCTQYQDHTIHYSDIQFVALDFKLGAI